MDTTGSLIQFALTPSANQTAEELQELIAELTSDLKRLGAKPAPHASHEVPINEYASFALQWREVPRNSEGYAKKLAACKSFLPGFRMNNGKLYEKVNPQKEDPKALAQAVETLPACSQVLVRKRVRRRK